YWYEWIILLNERILTVSKRYINKIIDMYIVRPYIHFSDTHRERYCVIYIIHQYHYSTYKPWGTNKHHIFNTFLYYNTTLRIILSHRKVSREEPSWTAKLGLPLLLRNLTKRGISKR